MSQPFDPRSTYLALDGRGGVTELPVGPDFWARIDDNAALKGATMVAVFDMDADWPHWELHPAGDEVLILLSGAMTLILDTPGAERRVELAAGQAVVVPAGIWHRALVPVKSRLLAITFGDGTEHEALCA